MYQRTGLLGWSEWKKGSEVSVGGPGTFYGARMCHSTGVPSMQPQRSSLSLLASLCPWCLCCGAFVVAFFERTLPRAYEVTTSSAAIESGASMSREEADLDTGLGPRIARTSTLASRWRQQPLASASQLAPRALLQQTFTSGQAERGGWVKLN